MIAPPSKQYLQSIPAEQREREEAARIARQKILIRVAADLALAEILRSPIRTKPGESSSSDSPGQEWLYGTLRDLLATDREHANVPILIALLKALGPHLLGPPDPSHNTPTEYVVPTTPLLEAPMAARFRKLCETYFATLSKRIVKEHQRLQDQDRRNHEAYIRSGEIFEDRQQNYEKLSKTVDKIIDSGKLLSDLVGVPMPTLSDASKQAGNSLGVNLDSKSSLKGERSDEAFASGKSPWEDEDTRRFYEDLVDLRDMIPPSLLGTIQTTDDAQAKSSQPTSPIASPTLSQKSFDSKSLIATQDTASQEATAPDEQLSAGPAAQLNALLARLPEMTNRTLIDSAAVEFALMNSKAARKRLAKQIAAVPRNRSDLLPYYGRLIATLNPFMPDIAKAVLDTLDDEFRYLHRKRSHDVGEQRAKNVRFIGELTKFKITPSHTIFHCFKVLLDDFSGPNVDSLAVLLETCGRFLLRTEDSSERMRSLLEMLRRKRAVQNLDHRQTLLIDNAYYQCNPPERKTIKAKQRSPMELYIRHLVYDELNARSVDKVLKLMCKLHWDDPETLTVLTEVFLRVWRVRLNSIHLLSLLIADLTPHYPGFVVSIVDGVCEDIRIGMETNLFKHNQRRVAMMQYLGELYVYRVVHSGLVLDVLWSLITFGHPNGRAVPGRVCSLDAPDDFFRIRLVCTLLDVCGVCFDRASLKRKMDEFLVFFNLYILSKEQPLPMDIEFMISDTLDALRPTFDLKRDWNAAVSRADHIMTAQREKAARKAAHRARLAGGQAAAAGDVVMAEGGGPADEEPEEEESSSDEDEQEDGQGTGRARNRGRRGEADDGDAQRVEGQGSESEADGDDKSEDGDSAEEDDDDDDDEDDDLPRRTQQSREELEAEEEFARELAKMTTESGGGSSSLGGSGGGSTRSSNAQRNLFESGLPFLRKSTTASSSTSGDGSGTTSAELEGRMRFQLLSKKGNKHQSHHLALPSDSAIATKTREMQIKELAERKQLKEYVLGYEHREEAEDRNGLEMALARQGIRVKQREREKETKAMMLQNQDLPLHQQQQRFM